MTMTSVLGRRQAALLLTPACLLLFIFFVYPLLVVAWRSFYSGGFTLDAYKALFDTPLFARVLGNTLLVSCVATVLSTVPTGGVMRPIALFMMKSTPK